MGAIGSVWERRRGFTCASILLAVCCHAQADGRATDTVDPQAPLNTPARLGFVASDAGAGADCPNAAGCGADSRSWSGYLLGFKKFFGAERLLSRLGLFGYGNAGHDGRDAAGVRVQDTAGNAQATTGRVSGYMLNLELPQLSRNAADQRYGWGGLTYIAQDDLPLRQGLKTRGVKYAMYFDECLRLEGLYGRSAGLDRYGLGLGQDNWSVSLAGGAGDARMSLHLGYAIPLDGSSAAGGTCGTGMSAGRSLGANGWLAQ